MNGEQLLTMDSNILLSIVNMKLRDEFDSLEALCEDYAVESFELEHKLRLIGYVYNEGSNQFIAE